MQNFSEKLQNIFQTKGHVGNGPRTKKPESELTLSELVIGAWETESLIGNGFRPYGLGINTVISEIEAHAEIELGTPQGVVEKIEAHAEIEAHVPLFM